jgi:sigma-B regulation protein RsbU (phosphoserine phosphatase)
MSPALRERVGPIKSFQSLAIPCLLILYVGISLTYQVIGSVSLIIAYLDLRDRAPEPLAIDFDEPIITEVSDEARRAGLTIGDIVESINGIPYHGRALWQKVAWYARPGELQQIGVQRQDGAHATGLFRLASNKHKDVNIGEAAFVIFLHIIVPLFCLGLGYWVVLARPESPHAWFILVLLSIPEAYISTSTYDWLPGAFLPLRLAWHIILGVLAPGALLWFGLLFPERSRIDVKLPWLKWLVASLLAAGTLAALVTDYSVWYDLDLIPNRGQIDRISDWVLNWVDTFCIMCYWIAIFDKLRTASAPDAKRRLRVLWAGSILGLGSILIIWGALPSFGIADPARVEWLGYLSAVLMLVFPLSLAYVVVVQRTMDLNVLLRMGTKYALARSAIWVLRVALMLGIVISFWQTACQSELGSAAVIRLVLLAIPLLVISPRVFKPISTWIDKRFFREAYKMDMVLDQLSEQVRSFTETCPLIETVSRCISEVLHVPQIAVLLRSSGSFELRYAVGISAARPILLAEQSSTIEHIRQTNRPTLLYNNPDQAWLAEADDQEKCALRDMSAELLLALPGRQHLMGIMALGAKKSEEPYSPSDLRLLHSVAVQTGLGLEVSELAHSLANEAAQRARVTHEIEVAKEVQERLFPQRIPAISGLSLAGACRPARGVGGDYYDFIELPDGRLGLAIGDVSGKGVSAALLMASLRACLRTMTLVPETDLAQLMARMNLLVYESSAINRYATFFFSIYDPSTSKLQYVNAGHNPPFLLRNPESCSGNPIRLETGGPVIGLMPAISYQEGSVTLQPGDLLLAYTDGICEAMSENDEEWGEERMLVAAEASSECTAEQTLHAIFAAADQFTGSASQHDDMTLLVLKLISSHTCSNAC